MTVNGTKLTGRTCSPHQLFPPIFPSNKYLYFSLKWIFVFFWAKFHCFVLMASWLHGMASFLFDITDCFQSIFALQSSLWCHEQGIDPPPSQLGCVWDKNRLNLQILLKNQYLNKMLHFLNHHISAILRFLLVEKDYLSYRHFKTIV